MEFEITFPGGKKVDAHNGRFTIKTDQSVEGGGDGTAPEPFTLFLASLGTCAGIYVLGFCQNRGIETKGIKLVQKHEIDPLQGKIEKINIEIQVPDDFPEKYHEALERVASMCAVKRVIQDPPEIVTETVVV